MKSMNYTYRPNGQIVESQNHLSKTISPWLHDDNHVKVESCCSQLAPQLLASLELNRFVVAQFEGRYYCTTIALAPALPGSVLYDFTLLSPVIPDELAANYTDDYIGRFIVAPDGHTAVIRDAKVVSVDRMCCAWNIDQDKGPSFRGRVTILRLICDVFPPVPIDPHAIPENPIGEDGDTAQAARSKAKPTSTQTTALLGLNP